MEKFLELILTSPITSVIVLIIFLVVYNRREESKTDDKIKLLKAESEEKEKEREAQVAVEREQTRREDIRYRAEQDQRNAASIDRLSTVIEAQNQSTDRIAASTEATNKVLASIVDTAGNSQQTAEANSIHLMRIDELLQREFADIRMSSTLLTTGLQHAKDEAIREIRGDVQGLKGRVDALDSSLNAAMNTLKEAAHQLGELRIHSEAQTKQIIDSIGGLIRDANNNLKDLKVEVAEIKKKDTGKLNSDRIQLPHTIQKKPDTGSLNAPAPDAPVQPPPLAARIDKDDTQQIIPPPEALPTTTPETRQLGNPPDIGGSGEVA